MRWLTLPGLELGEEFAAIVEVFVDGTRAGAKAARRKRA